ncbi:MAG: OadG family protein [Firmicutes bacterium]|jgi:Na+-transporting methylmalonyl-CoA/oxaloacetate decarboxylase gamma subunit|nr:OadG family protein [Bacillota bacterium]
MTLTEDLILGLKTTVLGMSIVFLGLVVLQLIMIFLSRYCPDGKPAPRMRLSHEMESVAPPKIETPAAAAAGQAGPPAGNELAQPTAARPEASGIGASTDEHSLEEVAAIAAALALATEEGGGPFAVMSTRRVGPVAQAGLNLWGLAGRQEIMRARQSTMI